MMCKGYRYGVLGGSIFALLLLFAPPVYAQKGKAMDTRGLSPAALSVMNPDVKPAALKKKAQKGDADAALRLGYLYRLGHKVKKDPAEAVKWFRKSADRGNAEGQLQMAIMYAAGDGVAQDYAEMRQWLQKSAENGYALSQFQLGLLYAKGITVDQDVGLARMWLGFAAEQEGEVGQMAKTVLDNMREEAAAAGLDFIAMPAWVKAAENHGRALASLQAAADKGDARSQYLMGLVFNWLGASDADNRMNVFYREAVKNFRLAADRGYPQAQYQLGIAYREGRGVADNDAEALSWLEKSGDLGYAPAQLALGNWYDAPGARHNPDAAKLWFERALAKRSGEAKAHFIEEEALRTAPKRRDLPVKDWDARDQFVMARAYAAGDGVPKDPEQAAAWYRLAASQLLPPAQREAGLAYLAGNGVAKDEAEAATWLALAAEQGDAEATAALAGLYAAGRGVPRDADKAFLLYRTAADAGIVSAEEGLALAYLEGRGVKQDRTEAKKWLEKAARASGTAVERLLALMQEEAE